MTKMRRRIYLAITAVAMAAMALPVMGVKVGAAGGARASAGKLPATLPPVSTAALAGSGMNSGAGENARQLQQQVQQEAGQAGGELPRLSDEGRLKTFGIAPGSPRPDTIGMSQKIAESLTRRLGKKHQP